MGRPCRIPPVRVPAGSKFCFDCSTTKPYADFAVDRVKWDGLRPMCRCCDAGRISAYRALKAGKSVTERIAQFRRDWQDIKADVESDLASRAN